MGVLEKLVDGILLLMERNKVLIWGSIIGFFVAMSIFASDDQVRTTFEKLYAAGYGIVGVVLVVFGLHGVRNSLFGVDEALKARGEENTIGNRFAGVVLALGFLVFGGFMSIGALSSLTGFFD